MEGALGLPNVSEKDTGKGKELKTGGKRSYNMPKECVERMMKGKKKMSRKQAEAVCYPAGKKGSLKRVIKSAQASKGGRKARKAIKKYEKKHGKLPQPY